jgi:hypothetical protein
VPDAVRQGRADHEPGELFTPLDRSIYEADSGGVSAKLEVTPESFSEHRPTMESAALLQDIDCHVK